MTVRTTEMWMKTTWMKTIMRAKRVSMIGGLAALALLSISAASLAQAPGAAPAPATAPGEAPPPGGPHRPLPKPTNLKVLPKNTSPEQVRTIMKGFEGALGVECSKCHVRNQNGHGLNFADDSKPEKAVARLMITMTASINAKYMAKIPEHHHEAGHEAGHEAAAGHDDDADHDKDHDADHDQDHDADHDHHGPAKVTCGTCHRGHAHPQAFIPPPEKEHHGPPDAGPGNGPGNGNAPAPPSGGQ